ncbi:unnamed protein product [Sphagnum balticum]
MTGEETEWMGVRRRDRRFVQHNACCFGINHQKYVSSHQLFMLDIESEEELSEESVPGEEAVPTHDEPVQHEEAQVVLKRKRPQYYDRRQQLELALAAQELFEYGDPELSPTELDEEESHGVKHSCVNIWRYAECLMLLKEGVLSDAVDLDESKRIHAAAQFLQKVELIGSIHNNVLYNVGQAQKQQKKVYVAKRDGKGNLDFEEGCRLCIIQDGKGHQWERFRQDLQIFYIPPD